MMRGWRWRLHVLALLSIVPPGVAFAEEFWIAWNFHEHCKDAGVYIYRQVEVEGYVDDIHRSSRALSPVGKRNFDPTSLANWDRRGYRFSETVHDDGSVTHLERTADGIVATALPHPTARYHYIQPRAHQLIGHGLRTTEDQVVDSLTGEVIAREVVFSRGPNFAEAAWLQYFGPAGKSCSGPLDKPETHKRTGLLYESVLTPKKLSSGG
jgi:hypothetical protein